MEETFKEEQGVLQDNLWYLTESVPELLLHIFSYLGAKDLGTASQVCSLWHAYTATPFLWRSLFHRMPFMPSSFLPRYLLLSQKSKKEEADWKFMVRCVVSDDPTRCAVCCKKEVVVTTTSSAAAALSPSSCEATGQQTTRRPVALRQVNAVMMCESCAISPTNRKLISIGQAQSRYMLTRADLQDVTAQLTSNPEEDKEPEREETVYSGMHMRYVIHRIGPYYPLPVVQKLSTLKHGTREWRAQERLRRQKSEEQRRNSFLARAAALKKAKSSSALTLH